MAGAVETGAGSPAGEPRVPGRRPAARRDDTPRAARDPIPVDWEGLARACSHPMRISILEVLGLDGGRILSPSELSAELQVYLSMVDYHVGRLAEAGLVELVRTRGVRGATEHFYGLPSVGSSPGGSA